MSYEIIFTRKAKIFLKSIRDKKAKERILKEIFFLKLNPYPRNIKSLKGRDGEFRLRIGIYRVIYSVDNNKVLIIVLNIDKRSRVYD